MYRDLILEALIAKRYIQAWTVKNVVIDQEYLNVTATVGVTTNVDCGFLDDYKEDYDSFFVPGNFGTVKPVLVSYLKTSKSLEELKAIAIELELTIEGHKGHKINYAKAIAQYAYVQIRNEDEGHKQNSQEAKISYLKENKALDYLEDAIYKRGITCELRTNDQSELKDHLSYLIAVYDINIANDAVIDCPVEIVNGLFSGSLGTIVAIPSSRKDYDKSSSPKSILRKRDDIIQTYLVRFENVVQDVFYLARDLVFYPKFKKRQETASDNDILYAGKHDRKIKYLITEKPVTDLIEIANYRELTIDQNKPWEIAIAIVEDDKRFDQLDFEEIPKTAEIAFGMRKGCVGGIIKSHTARNGKKEYLINFAVGDDYWFQSHEFIFYYGGENIEVHDNIKNAIAVERSEFGKALKNIFNGAYLREIAIELNGGEKLQYKQSLYIDLICNHFNGLSDFYIYLGMRQIEFEEQLAESRKFVLLPMDNNKKMDD